MGSWHRAVRPSPRRPECRTHAPASHARRAFAIAARSSKRSRRRVRSLAADDVLTVGWGKSARRRVTLVRGTGGYRRLRPAPPAPPRRSASGGDASARAGAHVRASDTTMKPPTDARAARAPAWRGRPRPYTRLRSRPWPVAGAARAGRARSGSNPGAGLTVARRPHVDLVAQRLDRAMKIPRFRGQVDYATRRTELERNSNSMGLR
jgi:hypothetical protein